MKERMDCSIRAILFFFVIFTASREANAFISHLQGGSIPPVKILEGRRPQCEQEGSEINLPFMHGIQCVKCICEGGFVNCKRQKCPSMDDCQGIVVKKQGECCPECQEAGMCFFQGKEYKDGEQWFGRKCTICTCRSGVVKCDKQICNKQLSCPKGTKKGLNPGACCESCLEETGLCTSFGDPHYQTFDKRMYNFQGKCKYVLAKDCATQNFTIQVRNEGRNSRTFSWTKSVFLHYNGMQVALQQNLRVKVNGHSVSLPYYHLPDLHIAENGYLMTVNTAIGVQIIWDGDSYTEVHVPKRYQNKTCGFCGNFDGNPNDDFTTPDGILKKGANEFATSWQVRNKRCEDDSKIINHPPPCRGENLMHARKKCFVLKTAKFTQCHGKVNPRPHFDSCVNDMCHCPRSQTHSCLCQSLTAYARLCKREGIDIRWRSKKICGVKCKGGAIYDDCGPACRLTCHNKDDVNKVCTKPCVAGCQCPAGKVWHKRKCITPSKCPK